MHACIAHALQGIDPDAPGAFWQVFWRLWVSLPWAALFWWSVVFVVVGAVLGWWRGRFWEGVVWAWLLGPVGWLVLWLRTRSPPPLRRRRPVA